MPASYLPKRAAGGSYLPRSSKGGGYLQQAQAATAAADAAATAAADAAKKQGGGGIFGGVHLPSLGVGTLIDELGAIPTGVAHLVASPFTGEAGTVIPAFLKGTASSLAATVTAPLDIATGGLTEPLTNPIRQAAALGDSNFTSPSVLGEIKQRGLLPALVENVGNAALLGGAGAAMTGASEAGKLATAAGAAEKATEAGVSAEAISKAAEAAQGGWRGRGGRLDAAEIPADARPAGVAAAKAAGASATPDQITAAGSRLEKLEKVAHPYRAIFNDAIHPLGKAASAAAVGTEAAPEVAAEAAPEVSPLMTPGPTEERIRAEAAKPVPAWATKAVENLPQPINTALAKTDRFIDARRTSQVMRERITAQDVSRRHLLSSDEVKGPRTMAEHDLVGRVLPDGTKVVPTMANEMLGDEMISRLDLTKQLEDSVTGAHPEAAAAVHEALQNAGTRAESASAIPREWLTDETGAPTELSAKIDDAVAGMRDVAAKRLETLQASGGKGLEGVGDRAPEMTKKSARLSKQAAKDLARADKLETAKVPVEAARHQRLMDLVEKRIGSTGEAADLARTRADNATVNFDATRAPEEAQLPAPVGKTEAQRANVKLPGAEDMTTHGVYREGVKGGRSLEQMKNETAKAAALDARKVALAKNLDEMKQTLTDRRLPSQLEADRLRAGAGRAGDKIAAQLANPSLSKVPAHWKPVWNAIDTLHKAAETDPMLADAVTEIPKTWATVLRLAEENGFDPTHVSSMQASEVERLIKSNVTLGNKMRDIGQTISSSQRKTRVGANARTRTFDALAAASIDATRELHTNALAKFIDDTWAKPIVGGQIPPHMVAWDPERSFLLTGERADDGSTHVEGMGAPTKMVPKEVRDVLRAYSDPKRYSHPIFANLRKVMDPWRLFMLTLSPRWYVNNFISNVMLATKAGVRPVDWVKAWQAYRKGGVDEAAGAFKRVLGGGAESFSGPESGALSGGFFSAEGGRGGTTIAYPGGREGFDLARSVSNREALGRVRESLTKANDNIDGLARVATYFSGVRRGMTDAKALHLAYESLVNFNDLSPFEREVVRTAVPFYAWQKGILKMVAKFPIDNPQVAGIMLSFDRINQEINKQQLGGELPQAYEDLIKVPGLGMVNTDRINPFADAYTLTTPQGIGGSLNPVVDAAVRNALGAPSQGSPDTKLKRVNEFGSVVPDTSPAQDMLHLESSLPQIRLAEALTGSNAVSGSPPKPAAQALENFVGLPTFTQAQVQAMVQRLAKSDSQVEHTHDPLAAPTSLLPKQAAPPKRRLAAAVKR